MPRNRPYMMVFAGLDPSAGAGLLADVKTVENNKVYALGVATAITVQDDETCFSVDWLPIDKIIEQAKPLLKKFKPAVIKTGIVNNAEMLNVIIETCREEVPSCQVVVDPVLSASSGFNFISDTAAYREMLMSCTLVTPNWNEVKQLSGNENAIEGAKELSSLCAVLLKGGHNEQQKGNDYLVRGEKVNAMRAGKGMYYAKHGSGCVLASAIAANLARGYDLHRACIRGRSYVQRFLSSDVSLLGNHAV